MGLSSSTSNYQTLLSHHPPNWFTVKSLHNCQVLRNKSTHQLADQYLIPVQNQKTLLRQLEIYQQRKVQSDNLVSCLELKKLETDNLCSNTIVLKVLTERIPHRISDVVSLTLREALYVIKSCLLGFRKIYQHEGPLIIDEEMIGFNQSGKVKVWLNTNFGSNQRSFINKKYLNTTRSDPQSSYQNQMNMIQTIFNMVLIKLPSEVEVRVRSKMEAINGFFNSLNWVDDCAESMGVLVASNVAEKAFMSNRESKISVAYQNNKRDREKSQNKQRQLSSVRMSPSSLLMNRNKLSVKKTMSLDKHLSNSREKTKDSSTSSGSLQNKQFSIPQYSYPSITNNNLPPLSEYYQSINQKQASSDSTPTPYPTFPPKRFS